MNAIFKKSLIKWSTLAVLGVSAYFLGYFWGIQRLGSEANARMAASETKPSMDAKSDQAADLGKLK